MGAIRGSNSAFSYRTGLFVLLLSCKVGSMLYQASLARLYPYSRESFRLPSGNKGGYCPFCPWGVEASVQLDRGKRRSMELVEPSKSSTYTAPLDPLPICGGCPGLRMA